jgi:hypothetical protein
LTETKIKQIRRLFNEERLAAEQIASRFGFLAFWDNKKAPCFETLIR